MEALSIVAGSWPIAVMVVAGVAGIVVWRLWSRAQTISHTEHMERARGSQAVVVQPRGERQD